MKIPAPRVIVFEEDDSRHNFDGTYGKVYPSLDPDSFFEELGIEPDREKIDYYILLDELF